MRVVKAILGLILAGVIGLGAWLYAAPPEPIRVGAGYSAKMVCSNAFLTGRDPQEVLKVDVQAPGHWLLRIMNVSVDREKGVVRAGLFGLFGKGMALYREGLGCASVSDGDLAAVRAAPV
ncbi:MAG: 6-aminohexanoate hydrolase, partial [Oricola sp.]